MSISSVSGVSSTSATSGTLAVNAASLLKSSSASTTDGPSSADKTAMSKIGQFMSKLSGLEKTDPAKAKQVLSAIADKLNTAASSATGDEATHLKDLAAKFTKAADTGDLSGIQPPKGGHGGHHHGPPPADAASSSDASDSSDSLDSSDASTSSTSNSKTEQYKHHGSKPDLQALDTMMEDAFSSVTGTSAAAA